MKCYRAVIVGLGLLLFGQSVVAEEPAVKLADQYLQASAPHDPNEKVRQALASPTHLAFIDTPLIEVAIYLGTLHSIDIQFDRRAMEDVGLSSDHPITITADDLSLQSGLRLMLAELELTYVVDQARLLITTPEAAESYSKVVFYPCADLIYPAGPGDVDDSQPDYDALIDLISMTVEPESWSDVGGPMPGIQPVENGIIVCQSDEIHTKIAALLASLRTAKSLPSDAYDPTPMDAVPHVDAAALPKLRASLDHVGAAKLVDTPLIEVAAYLSHLTGSRVLINNRAMEDAGISLELPVTCDFEKASTRVILDTLSQEHELGYVLENESILITTPENAESHMVVKVYPVRDLIDSRRDLDHRRILVLGHGLGGGGYYFDADQPDFDSLIDAICGSIEPNSWDIWGGPASIAPFQISDALVIAQTEQNHDKIAQLLYEVRTKRQPRPEMSPAAKANLAEPVLIRYPIPLDDDGNDAIGKLAQLLTLEVAAEAWNNETLYVVSLGKTTLLVKQSPETHAKIRQWLGRLYPESEYAQRPGWSGQGGTGSNWGSCYAPELFGETPGEVGGVPPTPKIMQDAVKSGM
ncbi:hypothetical protein M4951_19170 [Blastopirellula sp. J2-11]|uniref:hypothetical protein n=1 Tax=Blastopirellula sp. J2-11 TaxID=2943192 RepID=UPI0021CA460B|nr:hypothetical protein [Blastopirellula sp. J2-11]UUO05489.1 hypothetical protein M4951_19170 [Blastopirellula sp. J2-11]